MSEPTPNHMPGKEVAGASKRWTLFVCSTHPERPNLPGLDGNEQCPVVIGTRCQERPERVEVMPVSEHKARLAVEEARAEKFEETARTAHSCFVAAQSLETAAALASEHKLSGTARIWNKRADDLRNMVGQPDELGERLIASGRAFQKLKVSRFLTQPRDQERDRG